jgi:hypothetical protein
MSGRGDDEPTWHLNTLGQLKLATRLIRYGQSLPPHEFKVLLYIFDRTFAWQRSIAVITNEQFQNGVPGGRGQLAALPIGLAPIDLLAAIEGLVERGAIFRDGRPLPVTYSINLEWEVAGVMVWQISEQEFIYAP